MGIPDHVLVLGAEALTDVIGQWVWRPGAVLMSQLCPEGMEATMFAEAAAVLCCLGRPSSGRAWLHAGSR